MSHIVPLVFDVMAHILTGGQLYFARPDALQGSLIESLKWCRPTYFFAVPRVWEKIEIILKEIVSSHSNPVKQMCEWAQKIGIEKVKGVPKGVAPGIQYELANKMIFKHI